MSEPLLPGLAEEVVAAAGRYQRRRQRRRRIATVGSLAVAFTAVVTVATAFDAPPVAADLEITERNGRVEVRLVDVETRADVVEEALRDADIDADVVGEPVSPSLVGRFVRTTATGDGQDIQSLDSDGLTGLGFSAPAGFAGHIELVLGRPARAGEGYFQGGNPLSAGEPLACTDLPRSVRDLATVAADHPELTIEVRTLVDSIGVLTPVAEAAAGPIADWLLVSGQTVAPDHVSFEATPDGRPLVDGPIPAPIGCD